MEELFRQGVKHFAEGENYKAAACFQSVVAEKSVRKGLFNMAVCHFKEEEYEKAGELLSAVLQQKSDDVLAQYLLANTHYHLGSLEDALRVYTKVLDAMKGHDQMDFTKTNIPFILHRYHVLFNRGMAYYRSGQRDLGCEDISAARLNALEMGQPPQKFDRALEIVSGKGKKGDRSSVRENPLAASISEMGRKHRNTVLQQEAKETHDRQTGDLRALSQRLDAEEIAKQGAPAAPSGGGGGGGGPGLEMVFGDRTADEAREPAAVTAAGATMGINVAREAAAAVMNRQQRKESPLQQAMEPPAAAAGAAAESKPLEVSYGGQPSEARSAGYRPKGSVASPFGALGPLPGMGAGPHTDPMSELKQVLAAKRMGQRLSRSKLEPADAISKLAEIETPKDVLQTLQNRTTTLGAASDVSARSPGAQTQPALSPESAAATGETEHTEMATASAASATPAGPAPVLRKPAPPAMGGRRVPPAAASPAAAAPAASPAAAAPAAAEKTPPPVSPARTAPKLVKPRGTFGGMGAAGTSELQAKLAARRAAREAESAKRQASASGDVAAAAAAAKAKEEAQAKAAKLEKIRVQKEAEIRARLEQEHALKREAKAKAEAEAAAKAKLEAAQKEAAEAAALAQAKALEEERAKAEKEARAKAEQEARAKAEQEAQAKAKLAAQAEAEREAAAAKAKAAAAEPAFPRRETQSGSGIPAPAGSGGAPDPLAALRARLAQRKSGGPAVPAATPGEIKRDGDGIRQVDFRSVLKKR